MPNTSAEGRVDCRVTTCLLSEPYPPKGDIASLENSFFALKAGDMRIRTYAHNGNTVIVMPGPGGCAIIHDKDLWFYCIGQLMEAKNRGVNITPTVRFAAYDFLIATERGTSGRAYERMGGMLRRLKGTVIETNIETNGQRERCGFGLIDGWRVVEKSPSDGRMAAVEVDLPRWLFRSVEAGQVLTLSKAYWGLRKPLDRRIYELVRKHCGSQSNWRVSMAVLHQKSGSMATLRKFRFDVKALAENGELLGYRIVFDAERDMVVVYACGSKGRIAEARDVLAGRSRGPLEGPHEAGRGAALTCG
nr:replication initiator protein A [Stenotrophomonas sp. PS02297]